MGLNHPFYLFALSFALLWLSARIGAWLRTARSQPEDVIREALAVVLGAALTLLALMIGFTFSMAGGRYDQRKNCEEAEANAIGTEYVRIDLLPAVDAAGLRELLRDYLEQRILFYTTRDWRRLDEINGHTAQLQNHLWSSVRSGSGEQTTAVAALVLSGMNDVLNSQSYSQAAWWNRIPPEAWILMLAIGVFCNILFGYTTPARGKSLIFLGLPLIVSIAFFLLADMDSPRDGIITIRPRNLISLAGSLGGPFPTPAAAR